MGLALKQWSVYLGNVLLNFIHKECKNGSNSVQCSAREQHINNFMNQQISKHQHQISSNNHNSSRTTNAGNGCAVVTSTNSGSGSTTGNGSNQAYLSSCHQHSQQQYCPSCHYHNQLQHLMSPPPILPSNSTPQAYYNGYTNFFNNPSYNVRKVFGYF